MREGSEAAGPSRAGLLPARWQRLVPVALAALVLLALVGLGANAVRRAEKGASSRYDESVGFSRELVYEGINVYEVHPRAGTHTKYPPFFFVFVAPWVPLPTGLGAALWFLLNVALAAAATVLAVRALWPRGARAPPSLLAYGIPAALTGWVLVTNTQTSQVNIVILFFVLLAFFSFTRGRDLSAGLALGVAMALKLTPALLLLYFVYKGAFRVVAGAALGLVVCAGCLPLLVLGPELFVEATGSWGGVILEFARLGAVGEGIGGFRHTNQSLSAAFHRFFTEVPAGAKREGFYVNVAALDHATARWVMRGLSAVVLVVLAWLCRGRGADRRSLRGGFEVSLVLIAMLLLSPISWINHYVALLLPYAAAVEAVRRAGPRSAPGRRLLAPTVASFVLVLTSVSLVLMAFSLPMLGALVLALGLAGALGRERREATALA